jgi:hypothetical protein
MSKWGSKGGVVRLPSGRRLEFTAIGQNGILHYMGEKDISHKVVDKDTGEVQPAGSVIYCVFNDGRRIVTLTRGYALEEATKPQKNAEGKDVVIMKPGDYVYIELSDFLPTNEPTPMNDFTVIPLGVEGETVEVPEDFQSLLGESIVMNSKTIGQINYEKMDYPLRKV